MLLPVPIKGSPEVECVSFLGTPGPGAVSPARDAVACVPELVPHRCSGHVPPGPSGPFPLGDEDGRAVATVQPDAPAARPVVVPEVGAPLGPHGRRQRGLEWGETWVSSPGASGTRGVPVAALGGRPATGRGQGAVSPWWPVTSLGCSQALGQWELLSSLPAGPRRAHQPVLGPSPPGGVGGNSQPQQPVWALLGRGPVLLGAHCASAENPHWFRFKTGPTFNGLQLWTVMKPPRSQGRFPTWVRRRLCRLRPAGTSGAGWSDQAGLGPLLCWWPGSGTWLTGHQQDRQVLHNLGPTGQPWELPRGGHTHHARDRTALRRPASSTCHYPGPAGIRCQGGGRAVAELDKGISGHPALWQRNPAWLHRLGTDGRRRWPGLFQAHGCPGSLRAFPSQVCASSHAEPDGPGRRRLRRAETGEAEPRHA